MNQVFSQNNIDLPLPSQKTPTGESADERYQNGLEIQAPLDGTEIAERYTWLPGDCSQSIPRFLTKLCFGDFNTCIGLSNHNLAEIKEAAAILEAEGLKISAIQNHFSLLNRSSETSGILDYCKEHDIAFFSYMVLEQGALSGKYDTKHPFPQNSDRGAVYNPMLPQLEQLNNCMKEIAAKHGVSVAQIPVAWAIAKGTLPIIGVTKVYQVEDAALELSGHEIETMERLADEMGLDVIRYWEKEMR